MIQELKTIKASLYINFDSFKSIPRHILRGTDKDILKKINKTEEELFAIVGRNQMILEDISECINQLEVASEFIISEINGTYQNDQMEYVTEDYDPKIHNPYEDLKYGIKWDNYIPCEEVFIMIENLHLLELSKTRALNEFLMKNKITDGNGDFIKQGDREQENLSKAYKVQNQAESYYDSVATLCKMVNSRENLGVILEHIKCSKKALV